MTLKNICLRFNNLENINLDNLTRLQWVNLTNNNLQSVSFPLSNLIYLNIGLNNIKNCNLDGATHLKHLNIAGNKLQKYNFFNLHKIQTINLWVNSLEIHGLTALTNLVDLRLENKIICAVELASTLAQLSNLTQLRLRSNGFGCKEIISLAPVLGKLVKLKFFKYANNNVSPKGSIHLASALRKMINIQYLGLEGNNIGKFGMELLLKVFMRMPKLRELTIFNNNCSKIDESLIHVNVAS